MHSSSVMLFSGLWGGSSVGDVGGCLRALLYNVITNNVLLNAPTICTTVPRSGARRARGVAAIGNIIFSTTAHAPLTNMHITTRNGSGCSMVASRGNACSLRMPRFIALVSLRTPNCGLIRVTIDRGTRRIFVRTRRFADSCSTSILVDSVTRARSFSLDATLDISRRVNAHLNNSLHAVAHDNAPTVNSTVFVNNLGSLGTGTRPLVIISNIFVSRRCGHSTLRRKRCGGILSSVGIGSVRGIAMLGGTATLCKAGNSGNIVLVSAGHDADVTAHVRTGIVTNVRVVPSHPSVVGTDRCHLCTSRLVNDASARLASFGFLGGSPGCCCCSVCRGSAG